MCRLGRRGGRRRWSRRCCAARGRSPAPRGWPTRSTRSAQERGDAASAPIRAASSPRPQLDAAAGAGREAQGRAGAAGNAGQGGAAVQRHRRTAPAGAAGSRRHHRGAGEGVRRDRRGWLARRSSRATMSSCSTPPSPTGRCGGPRPTCAVRIYGAHRSAAAIGRPAGAGRAGRGRLAAGDPRRPLAQPADAPHARPRPAGAAHRAVGARLRPGARRRAR